jgi:hypothetical protein
MKRRTQGVALAAACCLLASAAGARADGADVTATALFDEGRKLMAQHKYAEGCPKLAESQRLAPSGGTLINLAECYERGGQTASAWGAWKDVAARANAAGKADVEKTAVGRATALEASLAKLTISVAADSDVPGLEVKRDGVALGHAEFGLQIPVDPGAHHVEATAPHRQPWSTDVTVLPKQTDAHVTVTLANGEPASTTPAQGNTTTPTNPTTPPPPTQHPAEESSSGSLQRTLGWVGVGVGGAGLVVGAIFGLTAMSKANSATSTGGCSGKFCSTPQGLQETKDAQSAATLSDVGFIAGGVLAAAGIVLVLTAPSSKPQVGTNVHVMPAVGQSFTGLTLAGDW